MKAFLRRDDYLLLGLQESPNTQSQGAVNTWRKAQTIAKANITLHLGSQAQIRTRSIIDDDDKTAYDLWTGLAETYTATNTQAVQNLKHQLDNTLIQGRRGLEQSHF